MCLRWQQLETPGKDSGDCKAIEEIDRQEAELAEKSRNITEKIAVGNSDYVPEVERQKCVKCNSEDCERCEKRIPAAMACEMKNMPASVVL